MKVCVYMSFFLDLGRLHPPHSYTLSSYVFQMDPSVSVCQSCQSLVIKCTLSMWLIGSLGQIVIFSNKIFIPLGYEINYCLDHCYSLHLFKVTITHHSHVVISCLRLSKELNCHHIGHGLGYTFYGHHY